MKAIRIPALTAACFLFGFVTADAAMAASSFRAKLTSGVEVNGELTDFSDGYYEFQVGQTVQRIKVEDLATLSQIEAGQVARTGDTGGKTGGETLVPEFTLRYGTGQSVAGRIVQFQDGYYDIATQTGGNVRVAAANVTHVQLAWQQDAAARISNASEPRIAKLSGHLRIRSSPDRKSVV